MNTITQQPQEWPEPVRARLLGGDADGAGLAQQAARRMLELAGYHTQRRFQSPEVQAALATAAADALVATLSTLTQDPQRAARFLDVVDSWLQEPAVVGELSQLIDPRFDSELDLGLLAQAFVALEQEPALPENGATMEAAIARFVAEFYEALLRRPAVCAALNPALVAELAVRAQARVASLADSGAVPPSLLRYDGSGRNRIVNASWAAERSALAQGGIAISGAVLGHVVQLYQAAPGPARLDDDAAARVLGDYLRWVGNAYDRARLYGLENAPVSRPTAMQRLSDVFIPVSLRRHWSPTRREMEQTLHGLSGLDALVAWHTLVQSRDRAGSPVEFADLLEMSDRLAIVGAAGTGKSTILAYLAARLATAALTGGQPPFRLPGGQPLIPLVAPLRYYRDYLERARHAPSLSLADTRAGTLAGFIPWILRRRNPALELSEDFFDRLLGGGGCLLMIDGLDEIASRDQRSQVRQEVEELVHSVYPGNHVIVTAREAGYRDEAVFGDDFLRLDVQPMDDGQIALLVENWCERLFPENVHEHKERLVCAIGQINALRQERNLPPLVSTPLMTTMVISVQWGETELPRERARLYEACVRAIVQAQYVPDDPARQQLINWGGPWEAQRDWLSELALAMHKDGRGGAAIREERVRKILRERLAEEELTAFLTAVRYRGGLFEERGEFFQFIHLTFQEFLTARLLAKQRKAGRTVIRRHVAESWWREVVLLTYGFLQMDYPPAAAEFIEWLSGLQGADDGRLAGVELAGAALLEMERPDARQRRRQASRLVQLLGSARLAVAPTLRAQAGRTLAALGDPRRGVGVDRNGLPDLLWCRVEEGDASEGASLASGLTISKYPVTVAQFGAFVRDGGYSAAWRDCWTDEGWAWKGASDGPFALPGAYGLPNHPMVMVTHHEAAAFCNWLSRKRGEQIALPTQRQWELAATGRGQRAFPWGDAPPAPDLANWADAGIACTTAVGIFPRGSTAAGVADLAGNVWEWCDSGDDQRPADSTAPVPGESVCLVLGGSYMDSADAMRHGHRLKSAASYRELDCGFRVVKVERGTSGATRRALAGSAAPDAG